MASLNPPFSDATVEVADDEQAKTLKGLGWTVAKATSKASDSKTSK